MTGTVAVNGEATALGTAYEHLRGHVLAGTPGAGDASAVILVLRAGLGAWIERRTAGAAAPAVPARCAAGPPAAEAGHASLVRVLASMAMAHGGERRSRR